MSSILINLISYLFEKLIGNGVCGGSGFLFPSVDRYKTNIKVFILSK
ncbi:MAG: hypothetical protein V4549_09600 [Bacteroidota bacterium]